MSGDGGRGRAQETTVLRVPPVGRRAPWVRPVSTVERLAAALMRATHVWRSPLAQDAESGPDPGEMAGPP